MDDLDYTASITTLSPTPIGPPTTIMVVKSVSSLSDCLLKDKKRILEVLTPMLEKSAKKRRMNKSSSLSTSRFTKEICDFIDSNPIFDCSDKMNADVAPPPRPTEFMASRATAVFPPQRNEYNEFLRTTGATTFARDAEYPDDMFLATTAFDGEDRPDSHSGRRASEISSARGDSNFDVFFSSAMIENSHQDEYGHDPFYGASSAARTIGGTNEQVATHREEPLRRVSAPPKVQATSQSLGAQEKPQTHYRHYQSEVWYERYNEIVEYKRVYGNCKVPHNWPQNIKLAKWVKRQRYQYKLMTKGRHSTMSLDRFSLLQSIGFVWDAQGSFWEEKFSELYQFYKNHGHTNVPGDYQKHSSLYSWVKNQRRQYRMLNSSSTPEGVATSSANDTHSKVTLTRERIAKLESIGFVWNV